MVRMMPAIRPIRFSALKALHSLHQEEERGEDDDRQADVEHVQHWGPPRRHVVRRPVEPGLTCCEDAPCTFHAAGAGVLTGSMRGRGNAGPRPSETLAFRVRPA